MTLHGSVLWLPKEYLWFRIAASGSSSETDFLCSLMYTHAYYFYTLSYLIIFLYSSASTLPCHAHTCVDSLTLFGGQVTKDSFVYFLSIIQ